MTVTITTPASATATLADDSTRTIDLGSCRNRDRDGRFVQLVTLAYDTTHRDTGEVVRMVRHIPAHSLREGSIGKTVARAADRGTVWNIAVRDSHGEDITCDFACFQY